MESVRDLKAGDKVWIAGWKCGMDGPLVEGEILEAYVSWNGLNPDLATSYEVVVDGEEGPVGTGQVTRR